MITKENWKSLSSDKTTVKEIIHLTENGEILRTDTNIIKMFNDYLSNVVQNLNIPRENSLLNTDLWINKVLAVIEKYKYYPSIVHYQMRRRDQSKSSLQFAT